MGLNMRKHFRPNLEPSSSFIGGILFWTELEGDETEEFPETPPPDLEKLPLAKVGPNILASTGSSWLFSERTRAS